MALVVAGTDFIQMPAGTTAQRPASPQQGMQRYNTTLGYTEVYNGTAWVGMGLQGQISFITKVLTSGTTYTTPTGVDSLYVFVVGATGGQSSGTSKGGRGGPGYSETFYASPAASYSYSIGAAGTTSGTAGGTTTFGAMSVTGSGGVTGTTGSAGGVGSGGTFNASGGTGGNAATRGGGGGGAGTRAGNGGNGANGQTVAGGGGGGTGGNNASGSTGGAAATTTAAGVIDISILTARGIPTYGAGETAISGCDNPGGNGALSRIVFSYANFGAFFPDRANSVFDFQRSLGKPIANDTIVSGNAGAGGNGQFGNSAIAGADGYIVVVEVYRT